MAYYYNRIAAITYALKWAQARNSTVWPDFSSSAGGGGDCTNFISQCLYAGGWTMCYGPLGWYSWPKRAWDHSRSWTSADAFDDYIKRSGRATPCGLEDLDIGDLISEEIDGHGIRHWMMVTKESPQTGISLSYHSTDYRNTSFQEMQQRVGTTNSLHYWKVLLFHPEDDRWSHVGQPYYDMQHLQNETPPPRS